MTAEEHSRDSWQINWPQFLLNLATIIVLCVYTTFSCNQVIETQNANSIAKTALAEVKRPYVMSNGIFVSEVQDASKTSHKHISVNFNNFGNTPAINSIWYQCKTIIRSDIIIPTYKCELDGQPTKVVVLGPKQPMAIVGPAIEPSDLDATRNESKTIYVFGYLTYEDRVEDDKNGAHKPRVTSVCQKIVQQNVAVTPTCNRTCHQMLLLRPQSCLKPSFLRKLQSSALGVPGLTTA